MKIASTRHTKNIIFLLWPTQRLQDELHAPGRYVSYPVDRKISVKLIFSIVSIALVCVFSSASFAQKKQTQPKWFNITTYDINSMEVNGKVLIKNVNEHLNGACLGGDPVETKEILEKIHSSSSVSVDLEDGPSDPSGKIVSTTLTVTYRTTIHAAGLSIPYSSKMFEQKFYRSKGECLKEREAFKKWLTEKNLEYRKGIEKYN